MRNRTNQIIIRLSDEELADLNEKVGKVRGSREQFIRDCISGTVIREAPPIDVPKLILEVRRVGIGLNQILALPTLLVCWRCLNSVMHWKETVR